MRIRPYWLYVKFFYKLKVSCNVSLLVNTIMILTNAIDGTIREDCFVCGFEQLQYTGNVLNWLDECSYRVITIQGCVSRDIANTAVLCFDTGSIIFSLRLIAIIHNVCYCTFL